MRILLTGSDGLIGKEICKRLSLHNEVIEIDKDNGFYVETLNTEEWVSESIEHPIDIIIHCASSGNIRDSMLDIGEAWRNIDSTFSIFEFARKINCKKIIYLSSNKILHSNNNVFVSTKRFGEDLAKSYKECHDIDYIIIRPETVWSIDDTNHSRAITHWISSAKKNSHMIIFGNKDKELAPIHVIDFVDCFLLIFKKFNENLISNKTYSISGKPIKAERIVELIKMYTNSTSKIMYMDEEISQPQLCGASNLICDNFIYRLRKEINNEVKK